ncbi:MAG: alpha/beta fold hydrolase [Burkholderiales bacterium]
MNPSILPQVVVDTAPDPKASVIWLHGLGDTGHGWSQVVPELGLPTSLAVRFVFPHAPSMPVTINGGLVMPAWYDIRSEALNERADLDGVRASAQRIEALIAQERERGVPAARIVVAGFSQGGVVALHVALRHRERLAGAVVLSAYLVAPEALSREAAAANRDLPVLMAHGSFDDIVRVDWGRASRDTLEAQGRTVEWHEYPMGHEAALEEIRTVGAFIGRALRAPV